MPGVAAERDITNICFDRLIVARAILFLGYHRNHSSIRDEASLTMTVQGSVLEHNSFCSRRCHELYGIFAHAYTVLSVSPQGPNTAVTTGATLPQVISRRDRFVRKRALSTWSTQKLPSVKETSACDWSLCYRDLGYLPLCPTSRPGHRAAPNALQLYNVAHNYVASEQRSLNVRLRTEKSI